ncbi:MAG: hypothetical protein JWP58_1529 [Hymenobacter sp.]|nr:hypothetical protein [Hymenobacter sp.]
MDEGTATLTASVIAALASIYQLIAGQDSEIRASNRKTLESNIHDLSECIHQTIATSNIIVKAKSNVGRINWRAKATLAKNQLKLIRPKVRYSLWGIDNALNRLSRFPDWIEHTIPYPVYSKKILFAGNMLGEALDNCVRKCYLNGRTPRYYEILWIRFLSFRFNNQYQVFKNKK